MSHLSTPIHSSFNLIHLLQFQSTYSSLNLPTSTSIYLLQNPILLLQLHIYLLQHLVLQSQYPYSPTLIFNPLVLGSIFIYYKNSTVSIYVDIRRLRYSKKTRYYVTPLSHCPTHNSLNYHNYILSYLLQLLLTGLEHIYYNLYSSEFRSYALI